MSCAVRLIPTTRAFCPPLRNSTDLYAQTSLSSHICIYVSRHSTVHLCNALGGQTAHDRGDKAARCPQSLRQADTKAVAIKGGQFLWILPANTLCNWSRGRQVINWKRGNVLIECRVHEVLTGAVSSIYASVSNRHSRNASFLRRLAGVVIGPFESRDCPSSCQDYTTILKW